MKFGPDAARYWIAAQGRPVARPFHLRWLLPKACGTSLRRWWAVWALSWPVLGGGMVWLASDLGWQRAVFAAIVVLALPGVLGPMVTRPVGVDLPALALGVVSAAAAVHGWWWLAVAVSLVAACVKESAPIFAALWSWSWVPLVGLVAVAVAAIVVRSEVDEVTARPDLRNIYDHPIRTAWSYRAERGWLMSPALWLHPWGVALIGLYGASGRTLAAVGVAHSQTVVATDTTRLVACGAGPALALAAAEVVPVAWMPVLVVVHLWWPFGDRIVA